jgi:hypothetical protein
MVRRIFSNVTTPDNFPQPGQESATLTLLLEATLVPYETDELAGLEVMLQMCNWDWGTRVLFAHEKAVVYLTTHQPCSNEVAIKRHEVVTKAIQSGVNLILPETMILLTTYKQAGVHGEKSNKVSDPLVGTHLA